MSTFLIILLTSYITSNICITIFGHICGADRNEKIMTSVIGLPILIWSQCTK